ncbi:hypothetical protein OG905_09025 [Streptomyces sp. NBC_00322]|nr:hypothetical protein [Streptomyces sp. NBC_00322]
MQVVVAEWRRDDVRDDRGGEHVFPGRSGNGTASQPLFSRQRA